MKRRILPLMLALALCLGLATPAFAVETARSAWGISFPDEERSILDERTVEEGASFKVRDWEGERWDEYGETGVFTGLGEVRDYVDNTLYLEPGDIVVMTAKNFSSVRVQAWSDPDGDGIYDQRLNHSEEILPITTVGPIEFEICSDKWYNNAADLVYYEALSYAKLDLFDGASIHDEDAGEWVDVPISVDDLVEQYGPKTLLCFSYWDEGVRKGMSVHLPDNVQPTAPAANTAYPSTQEVEVDGQKITFQCYALKDANGNDTNYIKLRDLADILNGSKAQFQVGWDGNITITTGQSYTKNGTEQNTPFSGQRAYEKTGVTTLVNGQAAELDTFQLKDDNGGGYTYYKLRDLGKALGITVDWSADRGIYIETK